LKSIWNYNYVVYFIYFIFTDDNESIPIALNKVLLLKQVLFPDDGDMFKSGWRPSKRRAMVEGVLLLVNVG